MAAYGAVTVAVFATSSTCTKSDAVTKPAGIDDAPADRVGDTVAPFATPVNLRPANVVVRRMSTARPDSL